MLRILALTLFLSLTTACAISIDAVPEDYSGPTATIVDTLHFTPVVDEKGVGSMMTAYQLNTASGKRLKTSTAATAEKQNLNPQEPPIATALEHKVSTEAQQLEVEVRYGLNRPPYAHTGYGKGMYRQFEFQPEAGETYTVSGSASEKHVDVWLNRQSDTPIIRDSYANNTYTKTIGGNAHYFELMAIDGKSVRNSFSATRVKFTGSGQVFTPVMVEHELPLYKTELKISGSIFFPTDFQSLLFNERKQIKTLSFTPIAGETYTVRGSISKKEETRVWIEDSKGEAINN